MEHIHAMLDAAYSYITAALAMAASIGLMHLGAVILLVARLIHDLPVAYLQIKVWYKQLKDKYEKNS